MNILRLKDKFQIEVIGMKDLLKVQEFELKTNPGVLTFGDIVEDLETIYSLDVICFQGLMLREQILKSEDSIFAKKYGYGSKNNLYFLKKGLWLINGSADFSYIGMSEVRYCPDGSIVTSEGPNNNFLIEKWKQGKPEYENIKYSFIIKQPDN